MLVISSWLLLAWKLLAAGVGYVGEADKRGGGSRSRKVVMESSIRVVRSLSRDNLLRFTPPCSFSLLSAVWFPSASSSDRLVDFSKVAGARTDLFFFPAAYSPVNVER